jgi:hypothetical protein
MLVHIILYSTTLTHGLVIGVVMTINEIDQYTMVCLIIRSHPVKINKGMRRKIRIPMVMDEMKGCINILPTQDRVCSSKT